MFRNPSIVTRIAVGKLVGFVIGASAFVFVPHFMPDAPWTLPWGIMLWHTTLGAIVGMFGVFTTHPVLKLPLPWWLRAPLIGAWMNFVLTFFAYDMMAKALVAMFGDGGFMQSPFWFTAEGAVVGLVIGYLATRFGGEGPETLPG